MSRRFSCVPPAVGPAAAFAAPVAASNHNVNNCAIDTDQSGGGAAALAALIAAAVDADVAVGSICNISVELLNNSLNNLLRNADIDVLNNALNNLLRSADITVTVLGGSIIVGDILAPDLTIVFV